MMGLSSEAQLLDSYSPGPFSLSNLPFFSSSFLRPLTVEQLLYAGYCSGSHGGHVRRQIRALPAFPGIGWVNQQVGE